ncbi:MFS general substrate transporter [Violaceomyces palustris]|uniref:MFS general substrate transporter n=1 Tax=Violaceomyces palustris TaxID=1673888 RepID=A0ACD0NVV1_9BASI|nr:MFS general substrate transporter [Violaceomyces palustris]
MTTTTNSLGLKLTRTHSRKDIYDADAGSVDGEFGSFGHLHQSSAPTSHHHDEQRPVEGSTNRIGFGEGDGENLGGEQAKRARGGSTLSKIGTLNRLRLVPGGDPTAGKVGGVEGPGFSRSGPSQARGRRDPYQNRGGVGGGGTAREIGNRHGTLLEEEVRDSDDTHDYDDDDGHKLGGLEVSGDSGGERLAGGKGGESTGRVSSRSGGDSGGGDGGKRPSPGNLDLDLEKQEEGGGGGGGDVNDLDPTSSWSESSRSSPTSTSSWTRTGDFSIKDRERKVQVESEAQVGGGAEGRDEEGGGGGVERDGDDDRDEREKQDPNLVTWDSPDSIENPRNWTTRRSWAVVVIVSSYTFLSPLSSSMIAPALPIISEQFEVKETVRQNLMLSSFVLAYAFGPLFLAPLSEMFGRRYVLQASNLFYLVFNVACGASNSSTQLTVFRFLAGLGGSAPLAIGGGTIADLFPPDARGKAMGLYSLAPLIGPCAGPIFGGWIVQTIAQWRWIFWASSIFGGLTATVGFLILPETYAPFILKRKADKLKRETGNQDLHTIFDVEEAWHVRFKRNLIRPFILMATQPIIQALSIYMFILYGCMYLLLTVFPKVFEETYGERPGIASLNYISLGLGFTLGGQVGGRVIDKVYKDLRSKNRGQGRPEFKLPLLMVTSFFLPVGLLIYGWTAEYSTHWIGPNIGAAIFSTGVMGSFLVCQGFLVDVLPLYAASALAAAVFIRSLGGFGFPLFAPYMYQKLGQGWGNSVLALISAIFGIPSPFLLWKYGPYLRSKSQYSSGQPGSNMT